MAVGLHSYWLQGCGLHNCLLQGFCFAQVLIVGLLVFTVIGCRAAGICFPDFRTAQGYCGAGGRGGITPESTSHLDILLKLFFPLSPSFPPSLLPFFLSPSPAPFSWYRVSLHRLRLTSNLLASCLPSSGVMGLFRLLDTQNVGIYRILGDLLAFFCQVASWRFSSCPSLLHC